VETNLSHRELTVSSCAIVDLPKISDSRGSLTFIEGARHVPFDIRRVYYLYDVPGGERRAGHAHLELEQILIAISGSFDVLLDDGTTRETVTLNRAHQGLRMGNAVWREISNFSSGAVCLVLASTEFAESDYIRDYDAFRAHIGVAPNSTSVTVDGLDQYTS